MYTFRPNAAWLQFLREYTRSHALGQSTATRSVVKEYELPPNEGISQLVVKILVNEVWLRPAILRRFFFKGANLLLIHLPALVP